MTGNLNNFFNNFLIILSESDQKEKIMTEQKARLVSEFYHAIADKQQTIELLEKIIASGEDIRLTIVAAKTDKHPKTSPHTFTFGVNENDFAHNIISDILEHERKVLAEMKDELKEMEG